MDLQIVNRIVPYLLLAVALFAHLNYCEWDFRDDPRSVSSEQYQRVIYFHHQHSYNIYLFAKTNVKVEKAQTHGVFLPMVMVVVAIGMLKLTDGNHTQPRSYAEI